MQEDRLRQELLAEVDSIAPILAENASISEKLGRLDDASMEAFRRTRLLKIFCPREVGGLEVGPITEIAILEALARIDGSIGWSFGIIAGSSLFAAGYLPAQGLERVFAHGVPPMAGAVMPRGRALPVTGGYRVSGRWSFGSGIHHAEFVAAGVFVTNEPPPEGVRLVVVPRDQVEIHDNWQVAGLRGSGSCDYSLNDVFVPEEMTYPLTNLVRGKSFRGGSAVRLGLPAGVVSFHMGVSLGIARHALDEISTQAIEKGRGLPPSTLVTQPHFQFALGKAEVELASARALAFDVVSKLYAEVREGRLPCPTEQAKARAAATYIGEIAQRVATVAFQAAGGSALFDTNPLQRCLRDVFAAGQHFIVSQSAYRALGQFKLNQPDANPML